MSSRTVNNTRRTYPPRLPTNRAPIRYKPKPKASASRYARKPKAPASADNAKMSIIQAAKRHPRGGNTLSYSLMSVSPEYAFNYMNPFNGYGSKPPMNGNSLGNFLTMTNSSNITINTGVLNPVILIYSPSVRGIYQLIAFDAATGANITAVNDSGPLNRFKASTTEAKPISIRPLRSGIQISNITESQRIAGVVRTLQISSAIEFEFTGPASLNVTPAFASQMLALVNSHNRTIEHTGMQYSQRLGQIVIAPATSSNYNSYGNVGFQEVEGIAAQQLGLALAVNDMSMNNQIILFNPTANQNNYTIKVCSQNALRFPANTTLGELQTAPPVVPQNEANIQNIHQLLAEYPNLRLDMFD